MRIFAVADAHGERRFIEEYAGELEKADLVTIAGDLSHAGDRRSAEDVLGTVERYNTRILAVHGNWDPPEVLDMLEERGYSLHGRSRTLEGIGFFGAGGSSATPMHTPSEYGEDEIEEFLSAGYKSLNAGTIVLLSHCPPKKARDRTFLGIHAGSRAVRTFLETHGVDLCLCGHIHEAFGIQELGRTLVVNTGSFKKGRHAVAEIGKGIEVSMHKTPFHLF